MSIHPSVRDFVLKNQNITSFILKNVRKAGFNIISGPNAESALLSNYGINLVFDVGANIGQYAMRTRTLGYQGRIISFEPISFVFSQLQKNAKGSKNWTTLNLGLGNYDGEAVINISHLTQYSSILKRSALLESEDFVGSDYIKSEKIDVYQLDSIFQQYYVNGDKVFLKIDVQGYEKNVLQGGWESLNNIIGIQLELSFVSHYEGEALFMEIVDFLSNRGFTLVSLRPLSPNLESGKLLQADGIFFRIENFFK